MMARSLTSGAVGSCCTSCSLDATPLTAQTPKVSCQLSPGAYGLVQILRRHQGRTASSCAIQRRDHDNSLRCAWLDLGPAARAHTRYHRLFCHNQPSSCCTAAGITLVMCAHAAIGPAHCFSPYCYMLPFCYSTSRHPYLCAYAQHRAAPAWP